MMRLATVDDLPTILEIVAAAKTEMHRYNNTQWHDGYPLEKDFLADIAANTLYVDEREGKPVGFLCLNDDRPKEYGEQPFTLTGKALVIHRLAVDPAWQKRGVAADMLAFAEETARREKANGLFTDTNSINEKMNRLIRKTGYRFVGYFPLHHDPHHPFCCYEKVF